ncbi:uncharacterized protein BDR25DRAFT_353204 [Lindgomyces ingoldianus]|uniref:Uncharacterized protein n=1 Tax=Lindgomyces ingoldianus TaxID=673940 RepID=A0ACB6R128_9PLEO|nr:uncharacterized protein BDR25DRAFT_353204 [Lindgomyces ingoldianus]KAF2472891.1 hypothetical protein BDR25DRAFT_353204 [Lindgomyces ingoldianus]
MGDLPKEEPPFYLSPSFLGRVPSPWKEVAKVGLKKFSDLDTARRQTRCGPKPSRYRPTAIRIRPEDHLAAIWIRPGGKPGVAQSHPGGPEAIRIRPGGKPGTAQSHPELNSSCITKLSVLHFSLKQELTTILHSTTTTTTVSARELERSIGLGSMTGHGRLGGWAARKLTIKDEGYLHLLSVAVPELPPPAALRGLLIPRGYVKVYNRGNAG